MVHYLDLRDDSVGEVLASCTLRPEVKPQKPCKNAGVTAGNITP